jgi:MFS family permease
MRLIRQYQGLRKEIYVLSFGKIVTCLGSTIWPMLTLILSNKLHMNASLIATLLLIMNIIQIPCMMFAGYLSDHYNKRNIIIICDFVTIICYFIISLFDINMNTVLLFFIAGLFAMMEHPAYDALIADLSKSKDRERAYSLTYLCANLGMVLAPSIGGLLFANHLRLSFFIDGFSTLLSTILIILLIKDVKHTEESNEYEKSEQSSLFNVLKTRHIIVFYLLCCVIMEIVYNQFTFLLPLNLDSIHKDLGAMYYGFITSVNAIVVVSATPILTMMLKKINDVHKLIISSCLYFMGLSMYIFIQNKIPFYFVSVIIFTLGEVINSLGKQPYLTKRIPESHRGRIFSLQRVMTSVFVAVSQKGVGMLVECHTYIYVWKVVSIVALISIVLLFILKYLDQKEYQFKKA